MKLTIYGQDYTLKELEKITGRKIRDTYDLDELKEVYEQSDLNKTSLQKANRKLNRILKNDLNIIKTPNRWNKEIGLKIACILLGEEGKCNSTTDKQNGFTGFCTKLPSQDDYGNTNGRCSTHRGKVKSTSKRKQGGRVKNDPRLKDNSHALQHGQDSREIKKLKEKYKMFYDKIEELDELTQLLTDIEKDELENTINMYDRMISKLTLLINKKEPADIETDGYKNYTTAFATLRSLLKDKADLIKWKLEQREKQDDNLEQEIHIRRWTKKKLDGDDNGTS
ncbi:hypothetical protein ACKXGF_07460 [Alkalibacillus sp. S2W]|uniref:hypothetical protein n=1 Tax=Alkalibacillus sp. S2W TaxID=3386553 RepID=UPI00398C8A72